MAAKKRLIIVLAGLAGVLVGCQAEQAEKAAAGAPAATPTASAPAKSPEPTLEELNAFKPPTAKGKVFFKDLKDGAKIKGKAFMGAVAVKLELVADGMTVEPAGAVHENTGHFALGIDSQSVPLGTVIKKNSGYQVYEKGEKEIQAGVRPGEHTLTLQLVDARNRSYGPEWAQTIKIKVTEK
ncbi:MAG: DUF4399 domain-containing protein [Deltaproteobacteria bacterium]